MYTLVSLVPAYFLLFLFPNSMDENPLQILATISTNRQNSSFCNNIENELPFIMETLKQQLSLTDEQTNNRRESEDDSDDEDDESPGSSSSVNRVQRRRSQRSKSIESRLHKVKRRTITKPAKKQINLNATENEIRDYYMVNSKKLDLKPSNLETIFEEGSPAADNLKLFGVRKLRRSLNCSDGGKANKTKTKARKVRVRVAGLPRVRRMTMETFLERLKSMQNESDEEGEVSFTDPRLNQTV